MTVTSEIVFRLLVALIDVKERGALGIDAYQAPFFQSLDDFLASGME